MLPDYQARRQQLIYIDFSVDTLYLSPNNFAGTARRQDVYQLLQALDMNEFCQIKHLAFDNTWTILNNNAPLAKFWIRLANCGSGYLVSGLRTLTIVIVPHFVCLPLKHTSLARYEYDFVLSKVKKNRREYQAWEVLSEEDFQRRWCRSGARQSEGEDISGNVIIP